MQRFGQAPPRAGGQFTRPARATRTPPRRSRVPAARSTWLGAAAPRARRSSGPARSWRAAISSRRQDAGQPHRIGGRLPARNGERLRPLPPCEMLLPDRPAAFVVAGEPGLEEFAGGRAMPERRAMEGTAGGLVREGDGHGQSDSGRSNGRSCPRRSILQESRRAEQGAGDWRRKPNRAELNRKRSMEMRRWNIADQFCGRG